MTPATRRPIGNILLAIAIVILVIDILGMAGVIHKLAMARELNVVALVLIVCARILRGRRRRALPSATRA